MYDNLKDFLLDEAIAEQEKYAAIKEELKEVLNVDVKNVYKFGSNPNFDNNYILFSIHRCGDLESINIDNFNTLKSIHSKLKFGLDCYATFNGESIKILALEKFYIFAERLNYNTQFWINFEESFNSLNLEETSN